MEAQIEKEKSWFKKNILYFAPIVIFVVGVFEYSFATSFRILAVLYIYLIGTYEVLFRIFMTVLDIFENKDPKSVLNKFNSRKRVISYICILIAMATYILVFGYNESILYAVSVGATLSILQPIFIKLLYT